MPNHSLIASISIKETFNTIQVIQFIFNVLELRHTVGMRLREVGVGDKTRAAILWHSNESITDH
jgi:hypothetical protein